MKKLVLFTSILLFLSIIKVFSQEQKNVSKKPRTVTIGTYWGTSNGEIENGLGSSFELSYLYHLNQKQNWVIGPYLITGAYRAQAIPTDISNQTFKSSSLGFQASYNLKWLRIGSGIGYNYTRGEKSGNSNFHRTYFQGRSYIGFVKGTKRENLQIELRPADISYGSKGFFQFHVSFLVHFNLR